MKWIYLLLGLGQQLTRVVAAPTTEPILLSGLSLTPATFYPNITLPTSILDPFPPPWLIKFYRPYCSHCKAFAPIWKDLQQKRETVTGLKFAQVDCIAHRDFCTTLNVTSIPLLLLFQNGSRLREYDGEMTIASLMDYVDQENRVDKERRAAAPEEASSDSTSNSLPVDVIQPLARLPVRVVEPSADGSTDAATTAAVGTGESIDLDGAGLQRVMTETKLSGQGALIKYYSPGCPHCQQFAPKWTALGPQLAAAQLPVQLYAVDCTSSINAGVCSKAGVRGYPTVYWFHKGIQLEYTGLREAEALLEWSQKMLIAAATESISPVTESDLRSVVSSSPVVFLFLHGQETLSVEDSTLINATTPTLLSYATFHTSSSPALFSLFNLPTISSHFLVFKTLSPNEVEDGSVDQRALNPISILSLPPTPLAANDVKRWLDKHKWPLIVELSTVNYLALMTASPPSITNAADPNELIVLYILSSKAYGGKEVKRLIDGRITESAKGWEEVRATLPKVAGEEKRNEVIHAYIDGDKWSNFLISTYGWGIPEIDDRGIRILVINVQAKVHYLRTLGERALTDAPKGELYDLIENGIWAGKAKGLQTHSPTAMKKFITAMYQTFSSSSSHPYFTLFCFGFLVMLIYRILARSGLFEDAVSRSLLPLSAKHQYSSVSSGSSSTSERTAKSE